MNIKTLRWILPVLLFVTACAGEPEVPAGTEASAPQTDAPAPPAEVTEAEEAAKTEEVTQEQATEPEDTDFLPELSVEVLAGGLSHPWDITEPEPGWFVFTERHGILSRLENGEVSPIAQIPEVYVQGEGGLTGVLADVDFSVNRYLYVAYNTLKNGPPEVVVTRFVLNEAREPEDPVDIVTGIPAIESGRHSGTRMRMGPDGVLWISTGDAATADNPQDPQSLGGKILRVNRNGEAVSGNLEEPFDARIFSYGHRNVQGIELFETPDGESYSYSAEHGPSVDDEINRLVPGNFGWDPVPPYDESVPMTDTDAFPDAVEALWRSGDRTVAISDLTILQDAAWGQWQGHLAADNGSNDRILRVVPVR